MFTVNVLFHSHQCHILLVTAKISYVVIYEKYLVLLTVAAQTVRRLYPGPFPSAFKIN